MHASGGQKAQGNILLGIWFYKIETLAWFFLLALSSLGLELPVTKNLKGSSSIDAVENQDSEP